MKYGFVYIWRDKKHNRFYIGSHWGTEDDGYICSSSWMKQAYKLRPEDFKRRILSRVYTTRQDLLDKEFNWFKLIKPHEVKTRYYNLNIFSAQHWAAYTDKYDNIRDKISAKTKEAMYSVDVREKYLEGLKTRDTKSSDEEVRKKRSESMKKTLDARRNDTPDYIANKASKMKEIWSLRKQGILPMPNHG